MITLELDGLFTDGLTDSVTYNDGTTDAVIEAVVDPGSGGSAPEDQATLLVKKTDVPAPAYRQTVTISGAVWTIAPEDGRSDFVLMETTDLYLLRICKEGRAHAGMF